MNLKQSWLYRQLEHIYGEEEIFVGTKAPKQSASYHLFPIKENLEVVGWLGLKKERVSPDALSLIHVFVQREQNFSNWEHQEEEDFWHITLSEEPDAWKDRFDGLSYSKETQFVMVYIYVLDEPDGDHYMTLKEMVEAVLEQPSFLLPLNQSTYSWIVPHYETSYTYLPDVLMDLKDTITTEGMINTKMFVSEPFYMPCSVKALVEEDVRLLKQIFYLEWDKPISQFADLSPLFMLQDMDTKSLKRFVQQTIGPVMHDHELLHTVKMFCKTNLNVSETAKQLFVHRNSLQYRLDKFIEKTGIDIRQFEEGLKVYLAILAIGILNKK